MKTKKKLLSIKHRKTMHMHVMMWMTDTLGRTTRFASKPFTQTWEVTQYLGERKDVVQLTHDDITKLYKAL